MGLLLVAMALQAVRTSPSKGQRMPRGALRQSMELFGEVRVTAMHVGVHATARHKPESGC